MPGTDIAHCGSCASRMVLEQNDDGWLFYRCEDCGEETEPWETATEAAEDVVWVPLTQARKHEA